MKLVKTVRLSVVLGTALFSLAAHAGLDEDLFEAVQSFESAQSDDIAGVIELIKKGADPNFRGNDGRTALEISQDLNNLKLFQALSASTDGNRRTHNDSSSTEKQQNIPETTTRERLNNIVEEQKRSDTQERNRDYNHGHSAPVYRLSVDDREK